MVVTKTFRLVTNTDGLEIELKFESPDKERTVVYNLLGPHGIPIEGEWYTGTFRDLVFGQLKGRTIEIITHSANDIATATKADREHRRCRWASPASRTSISPILVEPDPLPTGQEDRWDSKTTALVLHKNEKALQKSDVGVRITLQADHGRPERSRSSTPTGSSPVPRRPRHCGRYNAEGLAIVPQEPVVRDPVRADLARYRDHADAGVSPTG